MKTLHRTFAFGLIALGALALLTSVLTFSLPAFIASLFLLMGGGNTLMLYFERRRLQAELSELKAQLNRIEDHLDLLGMPNAA